jgi:hypothetical protein
MSRFAPAFATLRRGEQRSGYSKFFVPFVSFVVNFSRLYMQEDRKTLEQRAQMTELERLRHSASHVLVFCHSERSRGIS